MNYWLLKTEPETYSWDNLIAKGVDMWEGVRNYKARSNIRKIKKGDQIFIYHSGKVRGIVGLAEAVNEYYPDPTADGQDWSVIDVKPIRKLDRYISLDELKGKHELTNMELLKYPRLSVQPLSPAEFHFILKLESEKVE